MPLHLRSLRLALTLAVAVLASACELAIATDVTIDPDATGTFEVAVAVDRELRSTLEEAGVDLTEGIEDARAAAPAWEVERSETGDGGLEVRLRAEFDDAGAFADLADSLHAALDDEDPRLFEGLRIQDLEGGAVAFGGRVGVLPPSSPGARAEGLTFDEDDLARFLQERGDEFIRYDLRVTLPAPPREHDADEVDGASLTWRAPIGELREVSAVSSRPGFSGWMTTAVIAASSALIAAIATVVVRRRRRRRIRETGRRSKRSAPKT